MSEGLAFWILMLLWLVWQVATPPPGETWPGNPRHWGGSILLFILFGLLGWTVFGPPIHH